jgi:sporulation protein YlmC with PRC-barrel domain
MMAALALAALPIAALTATPATSQTVTVVDVVQVAQGYRASKMIGTKVKNAANEEIGTIDDLVIDQQKILYAILQVGGFLGLGGYLVAVPYENLEIADGGKTITLISGGSKEELQQTQEFKYGAQQK